MFLLVPWKVDVPRDRWPVMNWLIMAGLIVVFVLQVSDALEYVADQDSHSQDTGTQHQATAREQSTDSSRREAPIAPGITGDLILQDWSLRRLFGYMWIHAGLLHLAGNLLFLWIFGNAVCAKLGNVRYLLLYVLCGVVAGIVQLSFIPRPSLGASGAINGVVGMYLVLFYGNEITCLFAWLFLPYPYVRLFDVSSVWMILFWLFWDIFGALHGHNNVGYFAHLGGFASGFGIVILLCAKGWITMERYEKSLWQKWEERRHPPQERSLNAEYARLGLSLATGPARVAPEQPRTAPVPKLAPAEKRHSSPRGPSIRATCACGRDIKVSRQYASKTVRCHACNQYVVIPQATDFFGPSPQQPRTSPSDPPATHNGSIRFACTCGQKIRVPAQHAGRIGKCPQCGARLRVPAASA